LSRKSSSDKEGGIFTWELRAVSIYPQPLAVYDLDMNKKQRRHLTHSHWQQQADLYKLLIRDSIAKGLGSIGLVAASLGLMAAPVLAEGSAQVGLNQRLFEYGYTVSPTIPVRNRELYVDIINSNEVINVSICGSGGAADPLLIEIYNPSGFLVATQAIRANINDAGRVDCTDPFTAPLTNPFRYTTLTTGTYSIRLFNTRTTADIFNDITGSLFRRFDITVTPNTTTNPDPTATLGRLNAKSWAFRANTNDFSEAGSTDANYYIPVPAGSASNQYIWQLDLNNFAGLTYEIIANNIGVNGVNKGFSAPQTGNTAIELYPVYLSYPATALPEPSTPVSITNISFTDNANVDNTISPAATPGIQDSGTFKFTSNLTGNYAITIDTNQNGIYGDAGDTFLFGIATAGVNSVPWDGKNNTGTILPNGNYNAKIQVRLGEYHFVAGDAETSGGTVDGLTIRRALSQSALFDTNVYWDDKTLLGGLGGNTNLPNGGLSSTSTGKHTWGNFTTAGIGNENFVDTYTYGASTSFVTEAIIAGDDLTRTGSISGTVFEDQNYGGGAGRNLATTGTAPQGGATVELYKSDGTYVSSTTTSTAVGDIGKYSFINLTAGDYKVRVVNSTVSSSRTGYVNTLRPVQTFRTDAGTTAGSVSEVIDRVGGEIPAEIDAPARTGTQTLTNLNALTGQEVQSLAPVKVGAGSISGIDFGYNFDTIVNTNNTGQGSLRQFIDNSNALQNTGLDQVANLSGASGVTPVDPAPEEEVSIFMISDGAAHAGLRSGLPNLLTSGVASIVPATALPIITDAKTSIDGRTQTVNVGNTKTGSVGYSGTVGTAATASLNTVSNPEIQISNNKTISQGLNVTGNNFTARGISIYGFGNTGLDNNANILLNGSSNSIVEASIIGTASGGALNTAPATVGTRHGIAVTNSATNITIQDNAIAENGVSGIYFSETSPSTYSNITIQRNDIAFNGVTDPTSGDGITLANCTSTCLVQNNYIHNNKAYGIQDYQNKDLNITANTINTNGSGGTETSGIVVWGSDSTQIFQNIISDNSGDGVYLARTPFIVGQPLAQQIKISQNSFFDNGQLGIDLAGASANPTIGYRTGQTPYVTANDGNTGNTISNNGIDYPVITYSTLTSGSLQVKGFIGNTLTGSTKFSNAKLEFFIADNSPANQNGEVILNDGKSKSHGEGKTYIGSCDADANSQFNCTFPTAGTAGLTSATNITATARDSIGNTSEFSALPSDKASFILVKRITAVKDGVTNITTNFNTITNDPIWPTGYLVGAINGGNIKPGDEVEYTIYYLNGGENRVTQARICDRLNADLIFQPKFDTSATSDQGILFTKGISSQYLTNTSDIDQGFFSTSNIMPVNCNTTANSTSNLSDNVVVVDAATSSNPLLGNERGSVKFKVKIRQ
jgi:Right handed beta helix region/SdrD B-like domain